MLWTVIMAERQMWVVDPFRAASRWQCLYSCRARGTAKHLRLLILIFVLFVLSESPVQCCCVNESRPVSDCSFPAHSQSRGHVACILKDYRRHIDGCYHEYWTNNNDEIPGRVTYLEVAYYYTKCDRSLSEEKDQMSERCPSNCNSNNQVPYIAINITFKLDYTSASKLTALEIKLFGLYGGFHGGKTWCVLYEYGKGNVTYDDAVDQIFYFDGFIGLVPGYEYEVGVRTLPTARVEESTWNKNKIKTRPCWKPFMRWHPTPFAVNFTLTLNNQDDYKDIIAEYYIAVYSSENSSLVHGEQIVQNIDDKTHLFFGCMEPGNYTIEIHARGKCESCLPYVQTNTVYAGKPPINVCPCNIILYTQIGGNVSVTWPTPEAVSQCPNLARINTMQSHHSGDVFQEGTITEVRYEFWQFDSDDKATCSFYVNILSDVDPPVVTCSNVTLPAQSPNSFKGLIEGEGYTYSDANPDPSGITYNVTQGISGELFRPGHTPVTLVAMDTFHNKATCMFFVENNLTELPIICPSLDHNVTTDPGKNTYTFHPNFGKHNVTKSLPGYIYYGDALSVDITIGGLSIGSSVSVGTHEVVAIIHDDALTKTCKSLYNVREVHLPNELAPVAIIVGLILGFVPIIILASFAIHHCKRQPGKSKYQTCKEKLRNLTGTMKGNQPCCNPTPDVAFSPPKPDDGIDFQYLRDAEYSSVSNINEKENDLVCSQQESGYGNSNELDGLFADRQKEGHFQTLKMHQCEIHAASHVNRPINASYFNSKTDVNYSHEYLHHCSEDDEVEERVETNGSTKRPLLDRQDILLPDSTQNQPESGYFDSRTGANYSHEHLHHFSDHESDSDCEQREETHRGTR